MRIHTIGGYSEVGKNMTVLELNGRRKNNSLKGLKGGSGEDAIMIDMGLFLPAVVELEESEKKKYTEKFLRSIGALPDDLLLDKADLRRKVRSILIGHAHLDHVGGVPYMAHRYNADVVGTTFTMEVLKAILEDEKITLKNKIKPLAPNSKFIVKGKHRDYEAEFINMTHSTPQTALIAVHTGEGAVLYANDFKLDNTPVFGQKPNYAALKRIAKGGVKALIVDSLYSRADGKTPSEKVARHLLEEVMLTPENTGAGMIVSTYSSQIARLKSIVEFGKKLDRQIIFVGRSLGKYVNAAKRAGICPFFNDVRILSYRRQVERILRQVGKRKGEYLIVSTGHQGEPGSVLERISRNDLPYPISADDHVIFASKTIPTESTIAHKGILTKRLKKAGARIFENVHTSGHGQREDLRDLINITQPEHVIPSHGDLKLISPMIDLAKEMGYKFKQNSHLMADTENITFK